MLWFIINSIKLIKCQTWKRLKKYVADSKPFSYIENQRKTKKAMGINITTIYIKREEKSLFAYSFHYSLDHILVLSIKLIKRVKDFDKTRRNNVADGRYIY